jgi:hypothetical protein
MTHEVTSMRARVRDVARKLGRFTRQDIYAAFPGLDPRTEVGPAFDSLHKKTAADGCIVCMGRPSKRTEDGGREFSRIYHFVESPSGYGLPQAGSGAANRGGERNRIHAEVQHQPSGYEPGWFTALARAATEKGPHGFPPRYFKAVEQGLTA